MIIIYTWILKILLYLITKQIWDELSPDFQTKFLRQITINKSIRSDNPLTWLFFEACVYQSHIFEKLKKVFRYALGKCVYHVSSFHLFRLSVFVVNVQWIIADFSTLTYSRISMIMLSCPRAAHLHEKNITIFLRFFIDKNWLQITFWGGQFHLVLNRHYSFISNW